MTLTAELARIAIHRLSKRIRSVFSFPSLLSYQTIMASFKVQVPHQLSREDAAARLKEHSERARADMPREISELVEEWYDQGNLEFSFSAMGFVVKGAMVSCNDAVTVAGKIPVAALPFRGLIESQLVKRIETALAETETG